MGVRPREVDTSFCTETEIIEESAILRGEEGEEERGIETGSVNAVHRTHFTLEPPCNSRDISECSEDEYEDYEDEAHPPRGLRGCFRSRPCSVCLYLFLVLLLLSSFVSVIVVGILVAAPYQKASSFITTQCSTTQVIIDRHERKCSCGKGCNSKYPCLRLKVALTTSKGAQVLETYLAEDESALSRQCTFYPPCKSSREANQEAVRTYEAQYGDPAHQYMCMFNPDNPSEVIRTRRFKLHHVVHGITWSVVLFLLATTLLTFALRHRGCDFL